MNVITVTEYLSEHYEVVADILDELGFYKIRFDKGKRQFRFAKSQNSNPTSMLLDMNNLRYFCFSSNDKGNLYTLIMNKRSVNFPEALKYAAKKAGINNSELRQNITLPFGGFYKNIREKTLEPESSMVTYPITLLEDYSDIPNMMFYKDGIGFDIQKAYNVGYDIVTNRITVPIWTLKGELCGVMGRLNDKDCPHEERWLPLVPCSRSLTVFGYHRNYKTIQEKSLCIITESEKAPMQAASMGCNIVLSVSGCHISSTQAKYIKSLLTDRIIVAFDEGLDEDFVRSETRKLVTDNYILSNKVGYVWDSNNEIMKKGCKQSITDLGKERFAYAVKKKVKWLNGAERG